MKRIAVIGSGISGLSAAWALRNSADVTVFERSDRLGGHAYTIDIQYDRATRLAVDGGFIVYNEHNYSNLVSLFETLGVATQRSDMSFAVSDPDGWEWASTARGFFAQKENLFSPAFHAFWRTILKFNDVARAQVEADETPDISLGDWLSMHGFCEAFARNYILPMGAAIWSTPEAKILDYPAISFLQFFNNHRLMHKERPKWRTVTGGSRAYVAEIEAALGERVRKNAGVAGLSRFGGQVLLRLEAGEQILFDDVIVATHSDQARDLLDAHFEEQRFLLESIRYRSNSVFVHKDPTLMPKRKSAWASWNVLKRNSGSICLTYWMNRLQNLDPSKPVFITLNPDEPPAAQHIFHQYVMDHPQFDRASQAAVRSLKRIQGRGGIWFAGAWMGSGFHEDGLKSGLAAALSLGGTTPWTVDDVERYTRDRVSTPRREVKKANRS